MLEVEISVRITNSFSAILCSSVNKTLSDFPSLIFLVLLIHTYQTQPCSLTQNADRYKYLCHWMAYHFNLLCLLYLYCKEM
jgi:hypothetical protein